MQLTSTLTKFDISICVSCSRPNSFTHCLHTAYTGRPTAFHLGLFIRTDFSGESIGGDPLSYFGVSYEAFGIPKFPRGRAPYSGMFFCQVQNPPVCENLYPPLDLTRMSL